MKLFSLPLGIIAACCLCSAAFGQEEPAAKPAMPDAMIKNVTDRARAKWEVEKEKLVGKLLEQSVNRIPALQASGVQLDKLAEMFKKNQVSALAGKMSTANDILLKAAAGDWDEAAYQAAKEVVTNIFPATGLMFKAAEGLQKSIALVVDGVAQNNLNFIRAEFAKTVLPKCGAVCPPADLNWFAGDLAEKFDYMRGDYGLVQWLCKENKNTGRLANIRCSGIAYGFNANEAPYGVRVFIAQDAEIQKLVREHYEVKKAAEQLENLKKALETANDEIDAILEQQEREYQLQTKLQELSREQWVENTRRTDVTAQEWAAVSQRRAETDKQIHEIAIRSIGNIGNIRTEIKELAAASGFANLEAVTNDNYLSFFAIPQIPTFTAGTPYGPKTTEALEKKIRTGEVIVKYQRCLLRIAEEKIAEWKSLETPYAVLQKLNMEYGGDGSADGTMTRNIVSNAKREIALAETNRDKAARIIAIVETGIPNMKAALDATRKAAEENERRSREDKEEAAREADRDRKLAAFEENNPVTVEKIFANIRAAGTVEELKKSIPVVEAKLEQYQELLEQPAAEPGNAEAGSGPGTRPAAEAGGTAAPAPAASGKAGAAATSIPAYMGYLAQAAQYLTDKCRLLARQIELSSLPADRLGSVTDREFEERTAALRAIAEEWRNERQKAEEMAKFKDFKAAFGRVVNVEFYESLPLETIRTCGTVNNLGKNTEAFIGLMLSQKAAGAADESAKIYTLYQEFKRAYESRNDAMLMSFINPDWSSTDGTTLADIQSNFRRIFSVYDEIRYRIENLVITKRSPGVYTAAYDVTITSRIYKRNIRHEEKSSVSEEVILDGKGRARINRTLSGRFWYTE